MASPLAAASASSAGSWLALKSASAFLPASTVIFSSRYCWAFCVYIVSYMEMSATSLACADWRVVMRCCMASLLGSSDTAGIWSSVPATPNRLIESVPAKLAARKPWRSHASFCTAGVFNRFSSVPPFLGQGHQRVGAPHGRRRVDDDHVVLDLLERIRLVHGQIKHMWYAPESSLVTSPPFTSPSATALCVYSTIGELKTMSLWGGALTPFALPYSTAAREEGNR